MKHFEEKLSCVRIYIIFNKTHAPKTVLNFAFIMFLSIRSFEVYVFEQPLSHIYVVQTIFNFWWYVPLIFLSIKL